MSKKITNYSSPFQSLHNQFHSYSLTFPPNSRWTKQSFKDECDINVIMSRYLSTGELPDLSLISPQYLDVSSGFDFQSMQDQVIEAQSLFDALPSKIRSRFENDPGQFLAFVSDPQNTNELRSMGLLKPLPDPIPQRSEDSGSGDKRSASVAVPQSSSENIS